MTIFTNYFTGTSTATPLQSTTSTTSGWIDMYHSFQEGLSASEVQPVGDGDPYVEVVPSHEQITIDELISVRRGARST